MNDSAVYIEGKIAFTAANAALSDESFAKLLDAELAELREEILAERAGKVARSGW